MGLESWVLLQVVLLDVLEVQVGTVLQLSGSSLVANDDCVGVHLQGRNGPLLAYTSLDSVLQSASLVVTVTNDQNLLGIHNGTDTYCQSCLGHLVNVVVEETAVSDDGVSGQALDTGAACQ